MMAYPDLDGITEGMDDDEMLLLLDELETEDEEEDDLDAQYAEDPLLDGEDDTQNDDWYKDQPQPLGGTGGGSSSGGGFNTSGINIAAILGGATRGRAPAKPRRPTTTDALDAAGLRLYGTSYSGADTATRAAIRASLGKLDSIAFAAYGKGFRDLSDADKGVVAAQVDPAEVDPEDNPKVRAQINRTLSDKRRADAIKLYDERRKALWERQDRLREESLQRQRDDRFMAASTKQPGALKPQSGGGGGGSGSGGVSFTSLARVLPRADLQNLVSAWSGGSLGATALSPYRLQRMMATAPIANSVSEWLAVLQQLWFREGMPGLVTAAAQQSGGSGGRASLAAPNIPNIRRTTSRRR